MLCLNVPSMIIIFLHCEVTSTIFKFSVCLVFCGILFVLDQQKVLHLTFHKISALVFESRYCFISTGEISVSFVGKHHFSHCNTRVRETERLQIFHFIFKVTKDSYPPKIRLKNNVHHSKCIEIKQLI